MLSPQLRYALSGQLHGAALQSPTLGQYGDTDKNRSFRKAHVANPFEVLEEV